MRLSEITPFLHKNASPEVAEQLVRLDYQKYEHVFNDTENDHIKEFLAFFNGCETRFLDELKPGIEREVYGALNQREQTTYKICRSLAGYDAEDSEGDAPPYFYLSTRHLGERLGVESKMASRTLKKLKLGNVIRVVKKGLRGFGGKNKAARFEFLHSLATPSEEENAEQDFVW